MNIETRTVVTEVIFRRWKEGMGNGVIAIFPGVCNSESDSRTCESYMHVGQHGTCDPYVVIDRTTLCDRDNSGAEFLKQQLESAPYFYKLKRISRHQQRHQDEREETVKVNRKHYEMGNPARTDSERSATWTAENLGESY